MKYEQVTIFDILNESIKAKIIASLEAYEIDNLYKNKFKSGSYTFLEIYQVLSKNKEFESYLNSLAKELKKYIKESRNCHQDFIEKTQNHSFTKRDDCIMIYNYVDKSVGPIYCAEMLEESLFNNE